MSLHFLRGIFEIGGSGAVNDRLQSFLRACDHLHYLDLAKQGLLLAINQLTQPGGAIPPSIARAYPKGLIALQNARCARELARADLRALAELEHALENPNAINDANSQEKETLRGIFASITQALPWDTQARLARTSGERDGEYFNFSLEGELSSVGLYAITAILAFTAVVGLSVLPAAITFGGNAWITAIIPLACMILLAYILYRRV